MSRIVSVAGFVAAVSLLATGLGARDLRVAPGVPTKHPAYYMYERFAEYLDDASGGTMSATVLDADVVALPQMLDALQTNLIDVGYFLPLRFPAGMDKTNIAAEFSLMGRNPYAMALAMTEYVVTCRACQKEFSNAGLVFLGAGASGVHELLTTKPVRSAEDLAGLRLRSDNAPLSRWVGHFGAIGVDLPDGGTYQGLSRGLIDGTVAPSGDLLAYRLSDVVDYVTTLPLGTYHVTSNFTVAKPTWAALTDEEKAFLTEATGRANFDLTDSWAYQQPAEAEEALEEGDVEVIEPDASLLEASDAFIEADTAARVVDGGFEAARFVTLVGKWTAIVDEVGADLDALAERADEEIWSSVDWSSYGK